MSVVADKVSLVSNRKAAIWWDFHLFFLLCAVPVIVFRGVADWTARLVGGLSFYAVCVLVLFTGRRVVACLRQH